MTLQVQKCRMEDHLDEPSPLYGSGRYGKPDYIAYTEEELRKLIVQICFTTKKDG